jgi:maltose alpha-D-glucosyltransferase/alpha-amylase
MRINLGIRRRLAPLVGNDRRKMELLHGLLFSLPGTPVLYYGDEIGMGDNVFLGDRNGVRTPMQWSADRNAGFSRANPQRLILPIIIDPEYHYEAINVEAQQNNPNSLLWWTKRLIALRKQFHAFGRGTLEFLTPSNYRVLVFVRELRDAHDHATETVLVVANLSRYPQYVEIDLSKWKGMRPLELFGHTEFPPIGELPYLLTLPGYAFYWFSLEPPPSGGGEEEAAAYVPPALPCTTPHRLLVGDERPTLEDALGDFLATRRWFGGRGFRLTSIRIDEAVELGGVFVLVARVEYADREPERYVLPLATVTEARYVAPHAIVAQLSTPGQDVTLVDAMEDGPSARAVLAAVVAQTRAEGFGGTIDATPLTPLDVPDGEPANISAQHAAAAIRYGDRYLLKTFRRLEEGESPEIELGRFLNARAPGLTPAVVGTIEYSRHRAEPSTLAVLQAYVPNEGTAWGHAREEMRRFFERVLTRHRDDAAPAAPPRRLVDLSVAEPPAVAREVIGAYLDLAGLLGKRTAEMHLAFAANIDDASFTPVPYSTLDRRSHYQSVRNLVGKTLRLLRDCLPRIPNGISDDARRLIGGQERILKVFEPYLGQRLTGLQIRTHGDYHLEQLLYTGKDFVIIDFDGPPTETLAERRRKHNSLRDVAGMVRSFHYAAFTALLETAVVRPEDRSVAAPWADAWYRWVSGAFLRAYLTATAGAAFLPAPDDVEVILDAQVLQKAFHELRGELDRCAETIAIPLSWIIERAGL